jgi:hypothetical protein
MRNEILYEMVIPRSWGESKYRLIVIHDDWDRKTIAVEIEQQDGDWCTMDTIYDNETLFEIITRLVEKCKKD